MSSSWGKVPEALFKLRELWFPYSGASLYLGLLICAPQIQEEGRNGDRILMLTVELGPTLSYSILLPTHPSLPRPVPLPSPPCSISPILLHHQCNSVGSRRTFCWTGNVNVLVASSCGNGSSSASRKPSQDLFSHLNNLNCFRNHQLFYCF